MYSMMKRILTTISLHVVIQLLSFQNVHGYDDFIPMFKISPVTDTSDEKVYSHLRGITHTDVDQYSGLETNVFSLKDGLISISIAQDLVTHIPPSFEVHFFDDEDPVEFFEDVSSATPRETFWSGFDMSETSSLNILITNEDSGEKSITGSATIGRKVYNFATDMDTGFIKVRESDVTLLPTEDKNKNAYIDTKSRMLEIEPITAQDLRDGDDDGSTIDVMCIWTPQALCAENGQQPGCNVHNVNYNNVMRNKCNLAIRETNVAYENSGVLTLLNLVYSGIIHDQYVEEENMCDMLPLFQRSGDIAYRHVRQLRALKKADLVHMIVNEDHMQCGCGNVYNGNSDQAYSVSHRECTTGYFSFGHEIGHNMGCEHNRYDGATGSAFGYRSYNEDFRTIMSYNCLDPDGCPRIQRFSTRDGDVTHNGISVGDSYHDNTRQINKVRINIANFFKSNSQEVTIPTLPSTPPVEPNCGWNQVHIRIKIQTTANLGDLNWRVKNVRFSANNVVDSENGDFQFNGSQIISDHCIYSGNCYSFDIESQEGVSNYSIFIDGKRIVRSSSNVSARSHEFSIDATQKKFWMGMKKKQPCKWLNSLQNKSTICQQRRSVRFGCPVTCNSMCQI